LATRVRASAPFSPFWVAPGRTTRLRDAAQERVLVINRLLPDEVEDVLGDRLNRLNRLNESVLAGISSFLHPQ
jgi:hypothetical protein